MLKIAKILMVILVIVGLGFSAKLVLDKYVATNAQKAQEQLAQASLVRAQLVDIRVNLVGLRELDPNSLDFLENKEALLLAIESANNSLLETYETNDLGPKKNILPEFISSKLKQVSLYANVPLINQEISAFLFDYKEFGEKTRPIYNIYFPSDYEAYNVEFSAFYEGELQDTGIFTDVKAGFTSDEDSKFDTTELTLRLDQVQIIFEDCIATIGKESIAFADLADCEDALSMQELKELAYFAELTYFQRESFLNLITEMTNDIILLEKEINSLDENIIE